MTSPDDYDDLERRLARAFRAHGDSIEPSPEAYTRLARVVNETPVGSRRIRGVLAPFRGGGGSIAAGGPSRRSLAFIASIVIVAGLGGYSLLRLSSSPVETATLAPANADASDLVPGADEPSAEVEVVDAEAQPVDGGEATSTDATLADSAESPARSSVPEDSTSNGVATSAASDPVARFAGLTYAPVRVTGLEAAQAFLDLLAIENVVLEDRTDRVIVRSTDPAAGSTAADDSTVITTLTIGAKGDGFTVVDAQSDEIGLTIDNAQSADPTPDDIDDTAVVAGSIELTAVETSPEAETTVALLSAIDGSVLERVSIPAPPAGTDGFRLTVPVTGSERAWVVAIASDPSEGSRSLAARSVLYVGRDDPYRYTVVGLPPDDPDGGLVVRSTPNGKDVGVIELGSTGVRRQSVPPRLVDGLTWWAVDAGGGLEGWAAARYLAVDETPAEITMVDLARKVIAAVDQGDPALVDGFVLGKRVFVGSIVDPRPVSGLADVEALLTTKRRVANLGGDGPGSLADFYGFERWSDAEVFVPNGYREEGAARRARAFFGDLPSVVIRSRNPATGGWERVHLFVSRDGDKPTLVGLVLESEPILEPEDEAESPSPTIPSPDTGNS